VRFVRLLGNTQQLYKMLLNPFITSSYLTIVKAHNLILQRKGNQQYKYKKLQQIAL